MRPILPIQYLLFTCLISTQLYGHDSVVSEALNRRIKYLRRDEKISVIVSFRSQMDYSRFNGARGKSEELIRTLKADAARSQQGAFTMLSASARIISAQSFWIDNTLALDASSSIVGMLEQLPDVTGIDLDDTVRADNSWRVSDYASSLSEQASVSWNISRINADSVWLQYGLDGSGVLIGMMDTGIDTSHPAIAGRWRGGPNSWYDAINHIPYPYDDLGHGVGTTGIVVGGDGPGTETGDIGIAYNSKFIAAKMLSSGFSTISQVTSAAQWMLNPDGDPSTIDFPNVINNSWFSNTRGSTYFYAAAQAWRSAGIIPVFIAGNSGPDTGTTRSPGDHDNCLSVGGTNGNDDRYFATSVGPSASGPDFRADRRKPDFSAPGELVVTSTRGGGYGQVSGTSFAAPHMTGTIALMLQADPSLGYNDVYSILERSSVDLGSPGYDYVFGNGKIDALKAVRCTLGRRVLISPDSVLVTPPNGGAAYCSVRLMVPPAADVTISFESSDESLGRPFPPSIIFTAKTWNIPQTLKIVGKGDAHPGVEVAYEVNLRSSSADRLYNNVLPATIHLVNKDTGISAIETTEPGTKSFALEQNYPNPFNPKTVISYSLSVISYATLRMYDVLGKEVAILTNGRQDAGRHTVAWDAGGLASGVYFYRLEAVSVGDLSKRFMEGRKMVILR